MTFHDRLAGMSSTSRKYLRFKEERHLSMESAQLAPDTVPGDCFVPGTHLNAGLSKLRVEE